MGARLYRALVGLLPTDFRGDFGDAMTADVDGAAARRAGFWWREIRSLLAAVVREHADAFRQDLKYGLRTLRRTPAFTAMAILMLALGTGVNVAMFSIVDAVLLRSPFPRADQLAAVRFAVKDRPSGAVPVDRYRDLAAAPGPLVSVAAFGSGQHVLTGPGDPQNVDDIECVDPAMFDVLKTPPLAGRTFGPADNHPGAAPVIVLSYQFWRQLGGAEAILGSAITLNQTPVTVIGVMPDGFAGPLARGDVQGWLPRGRPINNADNAGCRQTPTVNVVARMRPGLSLAAAGAAMPAGFSLLPLESPIMDDVRTPFMVLMAAVAGVLLIACFNVGGLQMERSLARRREVALRVALGAGWGRLVRQTLTENLLLAFLGAAAGIAATAVTLRSIVSLLPGNVPYLDQIAVNGRVLALALGAAAAAGLIAGLLPLAETRRFSPARDLGDTTRASERRASWGRRALVVLEVALSIVVLIGAALMIQTFLTLRPSRPGFDPEDKLIMSVRLRGATPATSEQFFAQLFERLRATPGIRGAEGSTYFPMGGNTAMASITINGTARDLLTNYTTPGFFDLLKVPLVAGRRFTAADARGSEPVLIVNELLASRIRPDGRVVGQRITVQSQGPNALPIERTIVGVLANTRSSPVDTRPRPEAYIPYTQFPVISQWVVVEAVPGRHAEAAAGMRAAVRALRPDLVVGEPWPMVSFLGERMATTRFGAWVLGALAALAVALAGIGLAATIGWWVRQRTREVGVRIALGATGGEVTALVLRQGLTLTAIGIGAGCGAAAALTRYLTGWIYGVTPLDAATFAGCAVLMLLVAVCAVCVPVRRAVSVDPVIALKAE
jgi:putative ABC transport system permease protein